MPSSSPAPTPTPTTPPNLSNLPQKFSSALANIRSKLPPELAEPRVGIVCGSGLAGLAESLRDVVEVEYAEIEGFVKSGVAGHKSKLAFGSLGEEKRVPVVACLGRFHRYEGYSLEDVVFPVRVFKLLGCQAVIITNAAGALNPEFQVGTIVAVYDHFALPALTGSNPVLGPNLDELGTRFPSISDAYDFDLRLSAFRAARDIGLADDALAEGTYAWVTGPTYESRTECRFLRAAGADLVGMSTVPEVIAAKHAGIRVLCLSLVTNKVVASPPRSARKAFQAELSGGGGGGGGNVDGLAEPPKKEDHANHAEVLAAGAAKAEDMRRLVERIVETADV